MNTPNDESKQEAGEHTPGEWRVGDAGTTIFGPYVSQEERSKGHFLPIRIAVIPPSRAGTEECKANAQFIVTACNIYASNQSALAAKDEAIKELREALCASECALSALIKAAVASPRVVIQRPDFDSALIEGDNALDSVRAALAKHGGVK